MINCQPPEDQLAEIIEDRVKKNKDVQDSDIDILDLINKLLSTLKPIVKNNGLTGITPEIDKRVRSEVSLQSMSDNSETVTMKTTHPKCNDTNFVLENWIDRPDAPLVPSRINKLKEIHREILIPIVKYYKEKSDDQFIKDFCILNILTGLSTDRRLETTPVGEISRHYIGEAVNFRLVGIDDETIIDDLKNKRLPVSVGAFGNPNGVFVTLPYTLDGTRIENLYITTDRTGSLVYEFI